MSPETQLLRIEFATEETFRREYETNISNGGIFVATRSAFEARTHVCVEIRLGYADRSETLEGEVVHHVPSELAATGATPGVAVQFFESASEIRERLRGWIATPLPASERQSGAGRRHAPRARARVPAVIEGRRATRLKGRTRNLSAHGALVSSEGEPVPVGTRVQLLLRNPVTDEQRDIQARVVRHVEDQAGKVGAMGVQFEVPELEIAGFAAFIERLRAAAHARRLGGVSGALPEGGVRELLLTLGRTAPSGTLTLVQGSAEGSLGFEAGRVVFAICGSSAGRKALAALFAWSEGHFDFEARLDDPDVPAARLALEIEDLVAETETEVEGDGEDPESAWPPGARLRVCADMSVGCLGRTEQAVMDLARAGATVAKIEAIIPEPVDEVRRALRTLVGLGLLQLV